jgi:hypothetical protein
MLLLVQLGMVDSFCLCLRPCGTGSGLHASGAGSRKTSGGPTKKKMTAGVPRAFLEPRGATAHGIRNTKSRRGANEGGWARPDCAAKEGSRWACVSGDAGAGGLTQTEAVLRDYQIVDDAQQHSSGTIIEEHPSRSPPWCTVVNTR